MNQGLDVETNYSKQLSGINEFYNQRKIYYDNAKFLGIEQANCLYFPLCHMDLLIWQNIQAQGEDPEIIDKTATF